MNQSARHLVINASAEIDGQFLALDTVYFPTLIGAYLRALGRLTPAVVVLPRSQHDALRDLLHREGLDSRANIVETYEQGSADLYLDLREVHYPPVVAKAARNPSKSLRDPVWIIETRDDIKRAASFLYRYDVYLFARYLVIPVSRRIALALVNTRVSPDTVTLLSCTMGLAAAALPFLNGYEWRVLAAIGIYLSITLDFTDGYLARLRRSESPFGYWLDTLADEVVKFGLLLGLTGLVLRDGPLWALAPSICFLFLYHVQTVNLWLSRAIAGKDTVSSEKKDTRQRYSGPLRKANFLFNLPCSLDGQMFFIAFGLLLKLEAWVLTYFAVNYLVNFLWMLRKSVSTRA